MNLGVNKNYISWNICIIILLFGACSGLLLSCKKNCPDTLAAFKHKLNSFVEDINNRKRLKTDYEWDLIDKKYRNVVFECYPKFSAQLSKVEVIYFWENALGYAFVRFGADLLKKYGKTDRLLLTIAENINSQKIAIKPAVKRLCREWPVLYGFSEDELADLLKEIFEEGREELAE